MKKLSLIIALSLASIAGYAQTHQIYGHVQDANSQPAAGEVVTASIWNGWTGTGTTDANGDYSIDVPDTTSVGSFIDIVLVASVCQLTYTDSVMWSFADYQADFTVCPTPTYYIFGQVTAGTSGANDAVVYLINEQYDPNTMSTTLTAIDSSFTDTMNGYYTFVIPTNVTGTLKVKAALLPASADYADYLPTYYTSSLNWNGTGVTTIPSNANTTADFELIAGTNPGGPAFIGGDVLQGANKSSGPGDPLEGRILILTDDADVPVAYAHTDVDGHFEFPSLAYGTYKLFGDAWGKDNPSLTIILTANNPSNTTITFEENSDSFDGSLWPASVATAPELNNVSVYPNPVADVLNVAGLNTIEGAKTVTLTGINGAVAFNHTYAANEKVSISVSGLSSGMYMLQINTVKGNAIYKIVK